MAAGSTIPQRKERKKQGALPPPARGTNLQSSAYVQTMQCAGTLSWSVVGLAPKSKPVRLRPSQLSLEAPEPASAKRRAAEPPQASGAGLSETHRAETHRAHVEGPLEIDWSQIVRRCMDGDSGAWAEMVRAHHRRVYGLCYRFTGNAGDAEDLTQDVFLKIYSNLASFDTGRGSLQVWITTMTRNHLVDHFRRTRNLRATSSLDDGWESTEELKPPKLIDRLVAPGVSPHESAAQKELAKMVQNALTRVSVDLREAVILRDLQDLDYKEIAQVLAIPEGTVKSRISRGRAELARLLERNKREVV